MLPQSLNEPIAAYMTAWAAVREARKQRAVERDAFDKAHARTEELKRQAAELLDQIRAGADAAPKAIESLFDVEVEIQLSTLRSNSLWNAEQSALVIENATLLRLWLATAAVHNAIKAEVTR